MSLNLLGFLVLFCFVFVTAPTPLSIKMGVALSCREVCLLDESFFVASFHH